VRGAAVRDLRWAQTLAADGTPLECRPNGTFENGDCCTGQTALPAPVLLAQKPFDDLFFTASDASGMPIALELQPNTPMCVQAAVENQTDEAISTQFRVEAEAQPTGSAYRPTAPFFALTSQITISPSITSALVNHAFNTRANTQFWMLITHTYQRATAARLSRGANVLLNNLNWELPQTALFGPPSFISFDAANQLLTQCTYNNPSNNVVRYGSNPASDETCEAFGYFFPSTTPSICVNGLPIL
jgi:hypothetical protein